LKKINLLIAIVLLSSLQFSFKTGMNEQQMLTWSNKYFSTFYDPSAELKLKKWDLVLTDDAFIRLKKTYQNGKQEYYSFQLRRFTDMNYLGTTAGGILQLKTKADDIIVQTYDDPKGDIDSMATQLNLPVKNVEPEQLDSLMAALNYFKGKTL
jgi:hypothetical protein